MYALVGALIEQNNLSPEHAHNIELEVADEVEPVLQHVWDALHNDDSKTHII